MATNGVNSNGYFSGTFSSKFRLGGLATGLDTDSMVSDLMKAERVPLDKIFQKRQLSQWRRDSYRDVTNLLVGLKNEFMSVTKPATNILSRSNYKKFTASAVDGVAGTASTAVSVTANADAAPGSHSITVNKMASADTAESTVSYAFAPIDPSTPIDMSGKSFEIGVNGAARETITFGAGKIYSSAQDLAKDLQTMIDANANLKGKISASYNSLNGISISGTGTTKTITVSNGASDGLTAMGYTPGVDPETRGFTGVTASLTSLVDITDTHALKDRKFNITLDGITREIKIADNNDMDALVADLNTKIGAAFGNNKVIVSKTGVGNMKLNFDIVQNSGANRITLNSTSGTDSGLGLLGFQPGDSNRLSTGMTLERLASRFANNLTFIGGSATVSSSADITNTTWNGKKFNMTVDGYTSEIKFDTEPTNMADLVAKLQQKIDDAFGANSVTVSESPANRLTFTKGAGTGYFSFTSATSNDALTDLKISTGSTTSGQLKFTINNKAFTFNATQTLGNMMAAINSDSTANVKMSYDELTDKFKIVSNQLGVGNNLVISEDPLVGGNFFDGASGIGTVNTVTTQGTDASVEIDGQSIIRSSNSFAVNGIVYNLLAEKPGVQQNISLSMDTNGVFDNVKKFVDKYNEILDKINTKLSEKYERSYQPLTDSQKAEMKDEDIKRWEEKAKTGLLANDPILSKLVSEMRRAITDPITGESSILASIGISTGSYQEKGRLIIDETKLKAAIQSNPDAVANLLSKQSSTFPIYSRSAPASQRTARYNEEGVAQRLSDILEDYTSTFRDNSGKKGTLLEKAGLIGDSSEVNNLIYKEMEGYTKTIKELNTKLAKKEESYYKKFSNLEAVINRMNQQSSWLSSQLGGG